MKRLSALAVGLTLVAGCSGTAGQQATHATTDKPATHTARPDYTSPTVMIAKAKAAGMGFLFQCDKQPAYNIDGALSAACFGRNDETVYFDTFRHQSIGRHVRADHAISDAMYHIGNGWLVSAENPKTFRQLVAALR